MKTNALHSNGYFLIPISATEFNEGKQSSEEDGTCEIIHAGRWECRIGEGKLDCVFPLSHKKAKSNNRKRGLAVQSSSIQFLKTENNETELYINYQDDERKILDIQRIRPGEKDYLMLASFGDFGWAYYCSQSLYAELRKRGIDFISHRSPGSFHWLKHELLEKYDYYNSYDHEWTNSPKYRRENSIKRLVFEKQELFVDGKVSISENEIKLKKLRWLVLRNDEMAILFRFSGTPLRKVFEVIEQNRLPLFNSTPL